MIANDITIAVLAGGKSERMGRDKALLLVADTESLLARTVRVAGVVAERVVVIGRERPAGATFSPAEFLPDEAPNAGPLAGLATALRYAAAPVLALACDMPKLTPDALRWLVGAAETASEHGLVVVNNAQIEPLFSVYTPTCLSLLDTRMAAGRRSLQGLIAAGRFTHVEAPPQVATALVNVNTPEEWSAVMEAGE